MQVWIVGKIVDDETMAWEFQGVFSVQEAAVAVCLDSRYFVGPATIDLELPHDSTEWTGAYYPRAFRQGAP